MALVTPNLDDRTFQDLVDEAKKKIILYCPGWTDHNVSDPGVTLIELFAWMVETTLYRLNQVPDKHHIKLMELLGMRLQEPRPSRVPITFWLSAPQPEAVNIPGEVQVSTARVEGSEPVIFTTDQPLTVQVPLLEHILTRKNDRFSAVERRRLEAEVRIFSDRPKLNDALYLGFREPLDNHILGIELDCVYAKTRGIIPESPPLRYQAYCDGGWQDAELEEDGTGGLSWSGQIKLHLPQGMAPTIRPAGGATAYWVRIQVAEEEADQKPYEVSPEIRRIETFAWGGTVPATHSATIRNEILGRSDGSPGQVFQLERSPILQRRPSETVQVYDKDVGTWVNWNESQDFGGCSSEDRCFTCDGVTGEIRFGPALRQTDGTVHRYGAIPPRNAEVRFSAYRYGGGAVGNVRPGTITELKASIPYVDRVVNRYPASGGVDAEDLEDAKLRAPHALRTRRRAVTTADFEHLTRQEFKAEIARVRCLQARSSGDGGPGPGQIYILVIPRLPEHLAAGYVASTHLELQDDLRRRIEDYLSDHRLLTAELTVHTPAYKRVAIQATVKARAEAVPRLLEQTISARLEALLNPFIGGPEGKGWPFGRALYLSDLYACIQGIEGVEYIKDLKMSYRDDRNQLRVEDKEIRLLEHEIIVSDTHTIKAEDR